MKNILHLYSENTSTLNLSALITRTEGTVHNTAVCIPLTENSTHSSNTELSIPIQVSPTPIDPNKVFHFDAMVQKSTSFVEQAVALPEITLIHAHSLLAGGVVAHALYAQHHIPYVVAVTLADIRFWQDNPIRGRKIFVPVLEEANRIIFLNDNFQDFVADRLSDSDADRIFSRALTIHDGLDPFWIQNLHIHKPVSMIHYRLLVAGDNLSSKCLPPILKALQQLRKRNYEVSLTIAGSTEQPATGKDISVRFIPALSQDSLFQVLRDSDIYITPSMEYASRQYYAEALSQGVPLLHDVHNGLDGLCPDGKIGYSANTHSADDLAEKILLVGERFATIEQYITALHPLHLFNWDEIYRAYLRVYDLRVKS